MRISDMRSRRLAGPALHLLLGLLVAASGRAQTVTTISLDGSLPHGRTDVLSPLPDGVTYEVGELYGWLAGRNLFHSFLQFDVGASDHVIFSSTTPGIANVIARVTGGTASNIDGRITSQVPGADFYLLNPKGILFGPASQVNVPASLFVGSPTDLHFSNGQTLDLVDRDAPVLSIAAPEAFGFDGGAAAGSVQVASASGSPPFLGTTGLAKGARLTIAAGDIELFGNRTIRADGGTLQLASVGSAAMQVPVADITAADWSGTGPHGSVVVRDNTTLSTRDNTNLLSSQGSIVIRGGRFELANRAILRSAGDPTTGAKAVDVYVTGTGDPGDSLAAVEIHDSAQVNVDNAQTGTGGVEIVAQDDDILIRDGALIQSFFAGDGDGDTVHLAGRAIELRDGAQLVTATQTSPGTIGSGRGADIVLSGDRVTLSGGSVVRALTVFGGRGGDVVVDASEALGISGGAELSTAAAGSGAGGDIRLTSPDIRLQGGTTDVATDNRIQGLGGGLGPSGNIHIDATGGSLRILDGAGVTTDATGSARGGDITILGDRVEIRDGGTDDAGDPRASIVLARTQGSGASGGIALDVGDLVLARSPGSTLAGILLTRVEPGASGPGGAVDITARSVSAEGGGQISTTTLGLGSAGAVSIVATGDASFTGDNVEAGVIRPSGIFSRSETDADGNDITVSAANILVGDGAEISARARGTGRSGNVTLEASDSIRVSGTGSLRSVVSARGVDGDGGTLTILAPDGTLEVLDGASIDVSTNGAGDSGQLIVIAHDVIVEGEGTSESGVLPASIAAQTDGMGNAQGVTIDASGALRIGPGGQISVVSQGLGGEAGDVVVDAGEITVTSGRITARSLFGNGGSVILRADHGLSLLDGAEVTVEALDSGNAGEIQLGAASIAVIDSRVTGRADRFGGNITLSGGIISLENSIVDAVSDAGTLGPAGGNVAIAGHAISINDSVINANGENNAAGGFVDISADALVISTDSSITATSEIGIDGTVRIDAPDSEVTSDLVSLPENLLDASSLLEEACLARDAPSGSFSVREVGELPASPDAPLTPEPRDEKARSRCDP
jgi:filamentous hemagglutinin family protein